MNLVFIHPDLGVGGAERLIIDAAIAVKSCGHHVTILTNHYDPNHCFQDSQNLKIIVRASNLPRHVGGKFHAFFAYLKMILAAIWLIYFSRIKYDIIITDQISVSNIVFKYFNFKSKKFKLVYYCHFPDQLLCVYDKKKNYLKRIYRAPLDWLEMASTGMADVILVNSEFTKKVFYETFPLLHKTQLKILYPSINTEVFDGIQTENLFDFDNKVKNDLTNSIKIDNMNEFQTFKGKKYCILSINRYEKKKNLLLAINAMKELKKLLPEDLWRQCHLVHAGGFDPRVSENVEHFNELKEQICKLSLDDCISLLRSISDTEKCFLLRKSFCLLYTPINEHFGIVPIEAMYCEKPVIATNTGGPLETVKDNATGYLVEPNAKYFAEKIRNLIIDNKLYAKLSSTARIRVINNFSFYSFKEKLNNIINEI